MELYNALEILSKESPYFLISSISNTTPLTSLDHYSFKFILSLYISLQNRYCLNFNPSNVIFYVSEDDYTNNFFIPSDKNYTLSLKGKRIYILSKSVSSILIDSYDTDFIAYYDTNNIVDDRLIYLWCLYHLNEDIRKDYTKYFNETFEQAIQLSSNYKDFIESIILSEYPPLNIFYNQLFNSDSFIKGEYITPINKSNFKDFNHSSFITQANVEFNNISKDKVEFNTSFKLPIKSSKNTAKLKYERNFYLSLILYQSVFNESKLPSLKSLIDLYILSNKSLFYHSLTISFNKEMLKTPYSFLYSGGEKKDINVYYPCFTLNQFYSIYHTFNLKNDIINIIQKTIYYWNRNSKQTYSIISSLLNEKTYNDLDVFKFLYDQHSKRKEVPPFDRGLQRIKDMTSFDLFSYLPKENNFNYLDFGGGNGELGSYIGNYLKLNKSNIFVSDIKSWFGTENVSPFANKFTMRYLKTSYLPFEDDFFSFITSFQVLHHIKNYYLSLKEIFRILKKGGIFLIREHDCIDKIKTRILIDLEHSIREISTVDTFNTSAVYSYLNNYDDYYFSREELDKIIISIGFKALELKYPSIKGSTRFYYKAYIKP